MRARVGRRVGGTLAIWLAGGGLLVAACGGAAPVAKPSAAEQLAHLAKVGASARFTASYLLSAPGAAGPDRVTVYRSAAGIRVDITTAQGTSLAIVTPTGAYSCEIAGGKTACYVAAGAGGTLPGYLDPGLEHVFGSYLVALSSPGSGGYRVSGAGATAASASRPPGRCFRVSGGPGGAAGVAAGLYCLAADGVPTLVRYPPGELELISLSSPPAATELVPPASPTPLPSPS
jgi:hypothetical protein